MITCLLVLVPFTVLIPSPASADTPDWPDGTFHGTWSTADHNSSGMFQGFLNQHRRSTRGTFAGAWNSSDRTSSGTLQGSFFGFLLLGVWKTTGSETTSRFFGTLEFNDTHFSAHVRSLGHGSIDLVGMYRASFLPVLTGSFGVGVKSIYLQDTSRPENFTEDPYDVREMMVQLWYPIDQTIEEHRVDYMDYPTFQWLKNRSPLPLIMIPNNAFEFVRPHGRNHSSPAAGCFPVVIFSPGYDGVYQIYTSLIEDLVSHGFVVASINHPYLSGITVFPDGRTVGLATAPTDPSERAAFLNMSLRTIVEDAKYTLTYLTGLNSTDPVFSGHLNLGRVGMYGHSFGGGNTAVCCFEDSRFTAGLTLDGFINQGFVPGNVTVPFLMMVAEARFVNDSNVEYMWSHITNDTYKVGIQGSTHYAYTDVGVLLKHLVPLIPPKVLGFGTIAPKRMVNATRAVIVAYFDVYLNEAPLQRVFDVFTCYPEIQFEWKEG